MTIQPAGTSAWYDRSTRDIASLRAQAEALQRQLAGGSKLARSSDNPVAASRLRVLARAETLSRVDATNANRAIDDLKLADGVLSSFADTVTRARELAIHAGSETLSPGQRASIGTELLQIHGNLVSLANTRDSAGNALFGGETTGSAYTLDAAGNAVYSGTASAGDMELGEGQSVKRGLTGPEFLNFSVNGSATDLLAVIKGLGDALLGAAADPAQVARDALGPLDTALDKVTAAQTQAGARLAWIDLVAERRTALSEMHAGEEAEIGGTDMAAAIAGLQQIMLVLEASQTSFARLANLSLFDVLD